MKVGTLTRVFVEPPLQRFVPTLDGDSSRPPDDTETRIGE